MTVTDPEGIARDTRAELARTVEQRFPTPPVDEIVGRDWKRRNSRRLLAGVTVATVAGLLLSPLLIGQNVTPSEVVLADGGRGSEQRPPVSSAERIAALPVTPELVDGVLVAAGPRSVEVVDGDGVEPVGTGGVEPGSRYSLVQRGATVAFLRDGRVWILSGEGPHEALAVATVKGTAAIVPAAVGGRLWIQDEADDGTLQVREITLDGTVTFQPVPSPRGPLVAAVDDGLVLRYESLYIWDPRTDDYAAQFLATQPVGSHGDRLAACTDRCDQIRLFEGSGKTATDWTLMAASDHGAAFTPFAQGISPDGSRFAAVECASGANPDCKLRVVDVDGAGGEQSIAEGLVAAWARPSWSDDGRLVVVPLRDGSVGVVDVAAGAISRTRGALTGDPASVAFLGGSTTSEPSQK